MSVALSYLRDNFSDNIQGAIWSSSYTLGSATKAENSGQAVFTLPSSTAGTHQAAYKSTTNYDLTGDSFEINVGTMVNTAVAASAYFIFNLANVPNYYLRINQSGGTLTFDKVLNGALTTLASIAWNASTHKYWRIRESGGTIFYDTSSNGTSWTNRASTTVASTFAVTDLTIEFGAACGNVASPGSFRIDDVNLILPTLGTNWRWTQVEWPLLYRFRSVTLAIATGGTCQGYIATSTDGTTWTYYSGPIGAASGGFHQLTLQSSQAAAEAMAVNLPVSDRWDLPSIVECRYIRLYHRSTTGSSYTIREYYPRRLVQSDDVEAESIRTINLAAGSVTADKIFVLQLSAITANIGGLVIDVGGYLWQGSGTAGSPTTGLKIFNSGGIGKLSTYNSGVEQVTLDTDGRLKAGAGAVQMDANGLNITAPTTSTVDTTRAIDWVDASSNRITAIRSYYAGGINVLQLDAYNIASRPGLVSIEAAGTRSAFLSLQAASSVSQVNMTGDRVEIHGTGASDGIFLFNSAGTNVVGISSAGLGVNMLATMSDITADSIAAGAAVPANVRLYSKGVDTGTNYAMVADNSATTNLFRIRNDGQAYVLASSWIFNSDLRNKTNVVNLTRGMAHLRQLRPIKFDYVNGAVNQFGFVAQELRDVMPELVVPIDDGADPELGVLTGNLIPVIVAAIKEIAQRIIAIEDQLP